eukprot:4635825-Pleurochrysis_carterae.AAC.1
MQRCRSERNFPNDAERWRLLQAAVGAAKLGQASGRRAAFHGMKGHGVSSWGGCSPDAARLPCGKSACECTTAVPWRLTRRRMKAAQWAALSSRCHARGNVSSQ